MKALLIFGLKFGSDNQPLIDLGSKIKALGHDVSYAHWDGPEIFDPIDIIIGHSFGGDSALTHCDEFHWATIKYLALIDPVANWFPIQLWNYWKKFTIPSNVQRADCFQRSWNLFPPSGQIGNPIEDKYENWLNLPMTHAAAPAYSEVVNTILAAIGKLS